MALIAIASAAAGLAVGLASARVFTRASSSGLDVRTGDDSRAIRRLRTLERVCGITCSPSTRRHALALASQEESTAVLEHVASGPVRAAAVVDAQGAPLAEHGERAYLDAAASFVARTRGLTRDVWRVTWRSAEGIEITAQRCPVSRASAWIVCVSSGVSVDPVLLTRVAAQTGLLERLEAFQPASVSPVSPSDVRGRPAISRMCAYEPVLMVGLWTTDESGFDAGALRVPDDVTEAHRALHRWGALVEDELGSSAGVCFEVGAERFGFHPVGDGSVLAVATSGMRPHAWQRFSATARQLGGAMTMRRAS